MIVSKTVCFIGMFFDKQEQTSDFQIKKHLHVYSFPNCHYVTHHTWAFCFQMLCLEPQTQQKGNGLKISQN